MTQDSKAEVLQTIRDARQGDRHAVLAALRKALARDPDNLRALLTLAGLTRNADEAIAALERVREIDPDNEMARQGLVKLRAGNPSPPQDRPAQKPPVSAEPIPDRAPEPTPIDGSILVTLAKTVTWPFKDLNRPLGELLESGQVTWRDLRWAHRRAYDPIVKWAAAVCLQAEALQNVSRSLTWAAQVTWPFKDLNRPMGELLREHVINLHDLAYAVANAHDPEVRDAAAALGAQIVHPQMDAAPKLFASEDPVAAPSREAAKEIRAENRREPQPVPETETQEQAESPAYGQLHVIKGSPYLREQEEKKARQKGLLAAVGIGLLILAVGSSVVGAIASLLGFTQRWLGWLGLSGGMIGAAWWLVPHVDRLRTEAQAFAKGRRGEARMVAFLRETLDGRWALFRNVVLPGTRGDIDAVLVGPHGLFALEVKAYSGYYKNHGKQWQKKFMGVWRTLDHNPTAQALRNAQRLHDDLAGRGVAVWVEPRVVWAGSGKVWLQRPAARVWQFSHPAHIMEDLEDEETLPPEVIKQVVRALLEARRAAG